MPRRSIFEVIKDTFVGVLRAIREFIESVWYGKDYDKIQQEKIVDQLRVNKIIDTETKNSNERLLTTMKARNEAYKNEKITEMYKDINNSSLQPEINNQDEINNRDIKPLLAAPDLKTHITALEKNAFQIISDNIDNVLKSPQSFQCETNGQVYTIETQVKNDTSSFVKIMLNDKEVLNFDVEVQNDNVGNKILQRTDSKQKIQTLSDLNITNLKDDARIDDKTFKNELFKKAMEAIQDNKKFFEYNGHLFDTRINQANQCIIFHSQTDKFVLKKAIDSKGIQKYHENKELVNLLSYKGKEMLPPEIKTKKEFEIIVKNMGIQDIEFKKDEIKLQFPNNTFYCINSRNNNNLSFLNTVTNDIKNIAIVSNYIKDYFAKKQEMESKNGVSKTEKLKELIKEKDGVKIEQEINTMKNWSEINDAIKIIANSDLAKKEFFCNLLENQHIKMQEDIIAYIKDEAPENIEEVRKMLSVYDNIDALSGLNYVVKHDENISNIQKTIFENACKMRMEEMPSKISECKIPENCKLEELQRYKEHLAPDIAEEAEERIIKNVSDFITSCSYSNKQEELGSELPQMLMFIDDASTLNAIKEKVENECFMGDDMKNKFSQIFNERADEINQKENGPQTKETEDIEY